MKFNHTRIIVLAGIVAFIGIIIIQIYWLRQALQLEEKKFSQNIQVSLLEVANEIDAHYGYQAPLVNPVKKVSGDYYVVNIHNDFDAKVLELYLTNKFSKKGINTDFEYGIYDCETDKMIYGSYVNMSKAGRKKLSEPFPKVQNLVYYFAVRFPDKNNHIFGTLKLWFILSVIMVIVLIIYLYSIYVILQQKKYADLQKDFINNMTHEFKTPLSSILIAANYLIKQEPVLAVPRLKKYTQIVIDQSKKLNEHVENILSMARSDNSPVVLHKTSFNVIDVIRETIETIRLKYEHAEIILDTITGSHYITADQFHFANVMYNFLDNSVKYCHQQPVINILVSGDDKHMYLKITDNGPGIPANYEKHIFEKFYRVPGNNNAGISGFGLGLYYVQKICLLHQWKLAIENNSGEGITVRLTIST